MRYGLFLLWLLWVNTSNAQQNSLSQYLSALNNKLKPWLSTFDNCSPAPFIIKDTLHFDNMEAQDFKDYDNFLATHKPILYYNPSGSAFVDIYSYQLNLEKKGNVYYANSAHEQCIVN